MSIFRNIWGNLKAELVVQKERQEAHHAEATQHQPDPSASATLNALSEASDEITHEVEDLQKCNSVLQQQIHTVQTSLDLTQKQQHALFSPSLQTLRDMEEKLHTVQQTNLRLHRTIRDKRLLLGTKKEALEEAVERETSLRHSMQELRTMRTQVNKENIALKSTLAQRETDFKRVQQQHTTLSREHDALVGEHYQLNQELLRERRNKRHEPIEEIR